MSRPTSGNHHVNAAVTLALFVLPMVYLSRRHRRLAREHERYLEEREAERGEREGPGGWSAVRVAVRLFCISGCTVSHRASDDIMSSGAFPPLLLLLNPPPSPTYPTALPVHTCPPPLRKNETKRNDARTPEERLPLGARARQRIPTPTTTPPRHRPSRAVALSLRVPQHRRSRFPLESPIPNEVHVPTRGGDDHHVHE